MNKNNLDQKKVNTLLQIMSKKLGKPVDELKAELESGRFDKAFESMNKNDNAMFQKALNNPGLVKNMMNSRQAQDLYDKLCK